VEVSAQGYGRLGINASRDWATTPARSYRHGMANPGDVYAATRGRITELVSGLSEEEAAMRVPGCPAWSVKDVVSHLVGVCDDVLTGNIAGVATDPWTEAQVAARRERSLEEVLAEWADKAPQVEPMAEHFPGRVGTQWVLDVTTHEHDIRGALGRPGAQDSEGVQLSLGFVLAGLATSIAARGLAPLEVRAGEQSWALGGDGATDLNAVLMGEAPPVDVPGAVPAATVEASTFDWVRALTGRRSTAQVRAFKWSGDPEPYLPAFTFGPFRPSPVDVEE
jgi:uncharacterized protein (TIGR03083 family)